MEPQTAGNMFEGAAELLHYLMMLASLGKW